MCEKGLFEFHGTCVDKHGDNFSKWVVRIVDQGIEVSCQFVVGYFFGAPQSALQFLCLFQKYSKIVRITGHKKTVRTVSRCFSFDVAPTVQCFEQKVTVLKVCRGGQGGGGGRRRSSVGDGQSTTQTVSSRMAPIQFG